MALGNTIDNKNACSSTGLFPACFRLFLLLFSNAGRNWSSLDSIHQTDILLSQDISLSYMKFLDEMFIKVKVSSIFKEKNNSG